MGTNSKGRAAQRSIPMEIRQAVKCPVTVKSLPMEPPELLAYNRSWIAEMQQQMGIPSRLLQTPPPMTATDMYRKREHQRMMDKLTAMFPELKGN